MTIQLAPDGLAYARRIARAIDRRHAKYKAHMARVDRVHARLALSGKSREQTWPIRKALDARSLLLGARHEDAKDAMVRLVLSLTRYAPPADPSVLAEDVPAPALVVDQMMYVVAVETESTDPSYIKRLVRVALPAAHFLD